MSEYDNGFYPYIPSKEAEMHVPKSWRDELDRLPKE